MAEGDPSTPLRIADLELHAVLREIRLRGREIAVQPLVFELLLYLMRNPERVVGKEELLGALWPRSIVMDGALQRVVSLARRVLRQAGLPNAIRTYPRHGYRFCADTAPADAPPEPGFGSESGCALRDTARAAFERFDWESAVEGFR